MQEQEKPQIRPENIEVEDTVPEEKTGDKKNPSYAQAPVNLPEDNFSKARIVKYFPQSRYGFVKDRRGKDIYFNVDELRFVGDRGREFIREGAWVGYDVGWTSHGLHVNRMKIY
ncbi:MAG: hypothetical protein HQM15_05375 [Deltaproteobacteria bacterium]|nr:hypothetical protein [Deltaproteobacteria bacterium]